MHVNLRTVNGLLWLGGGACWLGGWAVALTGADRTATSVLLLSRVGLALVLLGGLAAGVRLVLTAPWWLRTAVGIGVPALLWALLETARQAAADVTVEAVVGALAVLVAAVLLVRGRRAGRPPAGGARRRR